MSSGKSELRRRGRFSSLTFRINAWYAGVLLVGVALLGGLVVFSLHREVRHEHLLLVEARLERHRVVLEQSGLPELERAVAQTTQLEGEHGPVRVRDRGGHTLFQHGDLDHAETVSATTTGDDLQLEIAVGDATWAPLQVRLTVPLLILLGGFLGLGVGGGIYLTRASMRPVLALATTVNEVIESGDLSRRVELRNGRGELDRLALLVNGMLERNQSLVRGMREALDNVAHDLRTPLARLRGIAEVALGAEDASSAREALADCIEETDRVLVMLRTLMDISEAEAGLMKLHRVPADVTVIARETVELYAQVAEEAGVTLDLVRSEAVLARVDVTRVRQAIANLVDNAVKYTARGGRVEVAVARLGSDFQVEVRDTGYGISAQVLPRIWERLYRGDPNRSERGLGLGLSLVRAIALAHGGRASVESVPGEGSTFRLTVPLAEKTKELVTG